MKRLAFIIMLLTTSFAAAGPIVGPGSGQDVDFDRDIRPIISANCFLCHGPDASSLKGHLRIDQRDSALQTDKHGKHPIVPGDPDHSELIRRINSTDSDVIMPPPESHKKLTESQKKLLREWITAGAKYERHWAYREPVADPTPQVSDPKWPINWIDNYIMARLDAKHLKPSPEADRITLIRRLSFDLTGLPPTPKQVDDFVNDKSPDAYEKVVDRLLASPHYGERMAVWWLDLVRYADTVGYHGDQTQSIYPYRDYVINAFNKNMPFDQFTVEQLGGDLLPHPTQNQLVATGYNRLLQTTHEGGAQLKEYRAIYRADRIRNVSQVWMGATMGCCQCHNHKYDPYTAKDFYSMGAFFADVDDETELAHQYGGNLNANPTMRAPEMHVLSEQSLAQRDAIDKQIADAKTKLAAEQKTLIAQQADWEPKLRAELADHSPVERVWLDETHNPGGAIRAVWKQKTAADHVDVRTGKSTFVQTANGLTQTVYEKAAHPITVAVDDTFYAWVRIDPKHPPKAIMLQYNDGSWEHRAFWGGNEIPYGRRGKDSVAHRHRGDLPAAGKWVRLEVPAALVGLKPGSVIRGMAFTQFGGTVAWDSAGVISGRHLPAPVVAALNADVAHRTDAQQQALRDYYFKQAPSLAAINNQIASLTTQRDKLEKSGPLTMYTQALATPRTVTLLPRGNWMDESGPVCPPAIPEFLGTLPTGDRRATRLDLARWLVTDSSPDAKGHYDRGAGGLTARVQANRFWYLAFNVGIARVLDDFGGQGESPVYPKLLDRLAVEFVRSGWDVKHMMKLIVMSRTYRQSSVPNPELAHLDPDNRLYARQSRPRLPAEFIRDNALAISGLLNTTIDGPSVKPYQPAGYYAHLNFPKRVYKMDTDANQWRRGVYIHWQRQFLHPMLKAFDAPSREECTASRVISNTPTQALTLLNDPTFVEAARVFATRILHEAPKSDDARVIWAFRQVLSRQPDPDELRLVTDLLHQQREQFTADPSAAAEVPTVGLTPASKDVDPTDLAAWTSVARVILNLNETITRS